MVPDMRDWKDTLHLVTKKNNIALTDKIKALETREQECDWEYTSLTNTY